MEHCAIDLGGRKSQLCIRDANGTILLERRVETLDIPGLLSEMPPSRVVMETAAEAFRLADLARQAGHELRVVPASLVKTLGVGSRRTKTDRRDAQVLSEVSCRIDLPSVHVPSSQSRQVKSICGMRDALVSSRTQLINNLRGWLRGQGYRIRSGWSASFTQRAREIDKLPDYVESQLIAIDALSTEIAKADRHIQACAEANP